MTNSGRKVKWNENNLEQNRNYFSSHPVLYEIDEPKTPFVHAIDLDETDSCAQNISSSSASSPHIVLSDAQEYESPSENRPHQSPASPLDDSMSSNDSDSWRSEDAWLAQQAKAEAILKYQSDFSMRTHSQVSKEDSENQGSTEYRKKVFESMRAKLRREEKESLARGSNQNLDV